MEMLLPMPFKSWQLLGKLQIKIISDDFYQCVFILVLFDQLSLTKVENRIGSQTTVGEHNTQPNFHGLSSSLPPGVRREMKDPVNVVEQYLA